MNDLRASGASKAYKQQKMQTCSFLGDFAANAVSSSRTAVQQAVQQATEAAQQVAQEVAQEAAAVAQAAKEATLEALKVASTQGRINGMYVVLTQQ